MSIDQINPCDMSCEKCGSLDVARKFHAKGSDMASSRGYDLPPTKYATGQCHVWRSARDHIKHMCRCCGYVFATLPMKKARAQQ